MIRAYKQSIKCRRGVSLLELVGVVTVLAVLAAAVLPRISISGRSAKEKLREQQIVDLNKGLERYRFEHGTDATDLDALATAGYFPDGVPVSPVDGSAYKINSDTGRIERNPND